MILFWPKFHQYQLISAFIKEVGIIMKTSLCNFESKKYILIRSVIKVQTIIWDFLIIEFNHIELLFPEIKLSLMLQISLPTFFLFSPYLFSNLPPFFQLLFLFRRASILTFQFLSFDLIMTNYILWYRFQVV